MRYIFWNIRGCGHAGRRTQLREYMSKERIDFVALQDGADRGAPVQEVGALVALLDATDRHAPVQEVGTLVAL